MASIRILAQTAPAAAAETLLYEVPQGKYSIINWLKIANRANAIRKCRVSITKAGVATANQDYVYYDSSIAGNDAISDPDFKDLRLEEFDVIRVYDTSGSLSFNLSAEEFGVVI